VRLSRIALGRRIHRLPFDGKNFSVKWQRENTLSVRRFLGDDYDDDDEGGDEKESSS